MKAVFESLSDSADYITKSFGGSGDVVSRRLKIGKRRDISAFIVYMDNMSDKTVIETSVLSKLLWEDFGTAAYTKEGTFAAVRDGVIATADCREEADLDLAIDAVITGEAALLIEGGASVIIISAKGAPNRGVAEADNEVVVYGPKDAFNETLRFNTVLIRRRCRDRELVVNQTKVGKRSKTDIAILHIEGVARPAVLAEAKRRIDAIDIDAVLDAGTLLQLIEDSGISPFPQIMMTERPDRAAAALYDGRIVVGVDNSPSVLILPVTINDFFHSPEDYYQKPDIMSFTRALRFLAALFAIGLPGLFIAVATFHPDMAPYVWITKIAAAQRDVPFPTVIEVLVMELAFELLREAGLRLPHPVGGAIGVVGGLIVGQAAVEAGLVSPVVVVVTALTGIAGFAVPGYQLGAAFRLMKYFVIVSAGVMGLLGFWAAILVCLIHISALKSFGVPYIYPFGAGELNDGADAKDSAIRPPYETLRKRRFFSTQKSRNRAG